MDTLDDLKKKVRIATIIGTFQSTLTNFRYIRNVWKKNAEEERLLGVSMTGIMDHPVLSKNTEETKEWLTELKQIAYKTNEEWANKLGIEPSVAICTIKPSGTVGELVNCASGIHPRYSRYYIRTVRADMTDPLAKMMKEQGVICEPDVTNPTNTLIFSFPKESPEYAVFRDERTAIEQLEHYKLFRDYWCDHNISITVYVKEHEWLEVGHWVYKNWDNIGGISFLPHTEHVYQQAPFQEIDKETYERLIALNKPIDFTELTKYEHNDLTTGMREYACVAGACELI